MKITLHYSTYQYQVTSMFEQQFFTYFHVLWGHTDTHRDPQAH